MQQRGASVHSAGEGEHLKAGRLEAHAGVEEHLQQTQRGVELVQGSAGRNPAEAAVPSCSPL